MLESSTGEKQGSGRTNGRKEEGDRAALLIVCTPSHATFSWRALSRSGTWATAEWSFLCLRKRLPSRCHKGAEGSGDRMVVCWTSSDKICGVLWHLKGDKSLNMSTHWSYWYKAVHWGCTTVCADRNTTHLYLIQVWSPTLVGSMLKILNSTHFLWVWMR